MEVVKKSYQVVTARMGLDANEQNLMTLLVKELKTAATNYRESVIRDNKQKNLPIPKIIEIEQDKLPDTFEFGLSDLSRAMGVTNSALSQTLKVTIKKMMQRVITWQVGKNFEMEQLLGPSTYIDKKGILSIKIHPRTKVAILEETRGVSIIDLKLSLSLKGGYEKRILDMISTFKNDRDFECEFTAFCSMVGSHPDVYKRGLESFRLAVLERPLKRIFKESNGDWEPTDDKKKGYILEKTGRTVKKIIFKVKYNALEETKNIGNSLDAEYKQLEKESNQTIAELKLLEQSILETAKLDGFTKIMINGYESTSKELNYLIPKEIANKIKKLTQV